MRILFFGDIYGKPGRKAVKRFLPEYRQLNQIDLCIANCENLADGKGVTENTLNEMVDVGVSIFSAGNHLYDRKEGLAMIETTKIIARPLNFPSASPGPEYVIIKVKNCDVMLLSLCGQAFMKTVDSPFLALEKFLNNFPQLPKCIIVDFHAESTA